jgi:hypothetical protein
MYYNHRPLASVQPKCIHQIDNEQILPTTVCHPLGRTVHFYMMTIGSGNFCRPNTIQTLWVRLAASAFVRTTVNYCTTKDRAACPLP